MLYKCKICNSSTTRVFTGLFDNRHGYPGEFKINKCINCGFMQTNPQLSTAKLTKIYTAYYPKRDSDIEAVKKYANNIPSIKEIYKNGWETTCHFQTKKGQRVLDVGCGTCQSLLEIRNLGGKAYGIDVDRNSENVAKKLKLKFQLGTIHNTKFNDNFFDLITASQVLEHEPEPIKFLLKGKKLLKTGGKIILSFPNTDALFLKIWGRNWLHWHIPYHLNHFNKKSVLLMAQKTGFKVKSLKTVTPNLWTILQLRSYLNNIKVGQRDKMWDGGSSAGNDKPVSRFLPLIQKFLSINRIIDKLGMGESFVLTLTNK